MSQSFKDTFGLDYLSRVQAPRPANTVTPSATLPASIPDPSLLSGMEAVVNSFGTQLLLTLRSFPDQSGSLLDLAQKSSNRLEIVLPVVQFLVSRGLLERVATDPIGNDIYKMTPAGESAQL